MDYPEELVRGSIVPVVLALLRERPMYGYEMVKLVNARSKGALEWKEGTLYPVLHRLQAAGKIKAQWRDAPGTAGGRKRKYYRITPSGLSDLEQKLNEWTSFTSAVGRVLRGASG
jgi:DNA-binding PadR family transcriptional regulator